MSLLPSKRLLLLLIGLCLLVSACGPAAPDESEQQTAIPQTPAVTIFVTQVVATLLPTTPPPPPTATPLPVPTTFDPNDPINAEIYYPLPGCSASRLHEGERAFVAATGDKVRLYASRNLLLDPGMRALERDEVMLIIGGPYCTSGWLLWEVEIEETEETGWAPEGNGEQYWLLPLFE